MDLAGLDVLKSNPRMSLADAKADIPDADELFGKLGRSKDLAPDRGAQASDR
jgi:hypothetical protein